MSKVKYILSVLAVLLSAVGAKAQFSINTVEQSANIQTPMNVYHVPLSLDITNESEARMIRKAIWRQKNTVDFKISFLGQVTQYNKSWTTNNENVISGELAAYYYHTYMKDRFTSRFKFDGIYGMNLIDNLWFKNQDMLKFDYLASWSLKKKGLLRNWAYSASATFQSQFSEGFKGRSVADRNVLWSNFMAPATLVGGLGLTYTSPNPKLPFIITLNPISGNVLFVMDDRLDAARRQALGIPVTAVYAENGTTVVDYKYKNYKPQGGSNLNIGFDRTFAFGKKKGVTLQYKTTLSSFYGWITQVTRHDPGGKMIAIQPTLNWTNTLNFNPMKFLTLEFRTNTVYDKSQVDKIQMQYYLRVGLTYRYKNK